MLALRRLTEHADCVLPVENQVYFFHLFLSRSFLILSFSLFVIFCFLRLLLIFVRRLRRQSPKNAKTKVLARTQHAIQCNKNTIITLIIITNRFTVRCESALSGSQSAPRPYDDMNNIVAHLLLNLTRSHTHNTYYNILSLVSSIVLLIVLV